MDLDAFMVGSEKVFDTVELNSFTFRENCFAFWKQKEKNN